MLVADRSTGMTGYFYTASIICFLLYFARGAGFFIINSCLQKATESSAAFCVSMERKKHEWVPWQKWMESNASTILEISAGCLRI